MKFFLVTYIFLKLFTKVILLVTTLESLMKIYLLLKELQQFMYFSHSISIVKHVSYQGLFLKILPGDLCKKIFICILYMIDYHGAKLDKNLSTLN